MKRTLLIVSILIPLLEFFAPSAMAQDLSPVGYWKTIDDKTGEALSIIKVWVEKDELFGRIEKLIRKPGQNPNPLCNLCPGEKKDKPLMGMMILWGFTQENDAWRGGRILDPDEGETYKCIVKVIEGGEKLSVRGYIGFPLIGRTQTWLRVDSQKLP